MTATNGAAAAGGAVGVEAEPVWHRVLAEEELPEGRVTTVHAGNKEVALVHYEGCWAALDNRCPHQGGPLGEGSIENGALGIRVTRASELDDALAVPSPTTAPRWSR